MISFHVISLYMSVEEFQTFKCLCMYFVSPEKKTFAEIVEPFIPVR